MNRKQEVRFYNYWTLSRLTSSAVSRVWTRRAPPLTSSAPHRSPRPPSPSLTPPSPLSLAACCRPLASNFKFWCWRSALLWESRLHVCGSPVYLQPAALCFVLACSRATGLMACGSVPPPGSPSHRLPRCDSWFLLFSLYNVLFKFQVGQKSNF